MNDELENVVVHEVLAALSMLMMGRKLVASVLPPGVTVRVVSITRWMS